MEKYSRYHPITGCNICNLQLPTCTIDRHYHFAHQHIYPKKPRIFGNCLLCDKILRGYEPKKFCSKSCAASFNNNNRKNSGWTPSDEQRRKTSIKLKGRPGHSHNLGKKLAPRKIMQCFECGVEFEILQSDPRKYCSRTCGSKHIGGAREKSGYSKSGYYKGIYCGSSYELVWVIYRLDHALEVKRFDGYILYGDGKKYFPDFVEENTIHEMKGWVCTKSDTVLKQKDTGANQAGYTVKLYFKEDLATEFQWVKDNYQYKNIEELYDDFKFKFSYVCSYCGDNFQTNKKRTTNIKFCSRQCSGKSRVGSRTTKFTE
jgi:DNA-directed RNA polymerase subunit RPC12/RpoP